VNPVSTVFLTHRGEWFYDCCAAERRLRQLLQGHSVSDNKANWRAMQQEASHAQNPRGGQLPLNQ
ncbi:MAG: hypothetical protein ACRES0_23195, partial [Pseudomonas sp.]